MIAPGQTRRSAVPASQMHKCACHTCTAQIAPWLLMCKPHWFSLPGDLRDAITTEADACKRAGIKHSDALIALRARAIAFHAKQPALLQ